MKTHGSADGVVTLYSLPFCSHCTGCEGTCDGGGDGDGEGEGEGQSMVTMTRSCCPSCVPRRLQLHPPAPAWTPGFYYFGIVKRSIVGRGPAAGCLNGAASRGQDQLRGAAGF